MPRIYATFMPRIYATHLRHTFMPHVYATHLRHIYATHLRHTERIVGDTARLLDEKGALAGNITRTDLRRAMEEVVQNTIERYERTRGRHDIIAAQDPGADMVKPQFYRWSNNTFHRLPEDFVLTCIGTGETGNVAKTPLQGFLRWNMADYCHGICAIRTCEATDFAIKNQRKRFSDWKRLYNGWEALLVKQGVMPLLGQDRRNATVDDWTSRFQKVFELHCTLVAIWHRSKTKRQRVRKNPTAFMTLKISTTLTDYRVITNSIERFRSSRGYRGLVRCQRRYKEHGGMVRIGGVLKWRDEA